MKNHLLLLCPALLLWFLAERVSSFCPSSGFTKPPSTLRLTFPTKLYSSTTTLFSVGSTNLDNSEQHHPLSTRSKLRQLTGFSLTAFRATLRGITGVSLSGVISNTIKTILDVFRPGMRWVIQPLLILYYVPILIVRYYLIGPSEQYVNDSRSGHEKLVDGWRKAVEIAEKAHADGYWPVHLNGE